MTAMKIAGPRGKHAVRHDAPARDREPDSPWYCASHPASCCSVALAALRQSMARGTPLSRREPVGANLGVIDESCTGLYDAAMTLPMALTASRLVLAPVFFVLFELAVQGSPFS